MSRNRDPNTTQNLHVCTIFCRPEVDNDIISGTAVDNVGLDAPVKFGDSTSNGFRYIRGAAFVASERTIERTNIAKAYSNSANGVRGSPNNVLLDAERKGERV